MNKFYNLTVIFVFLSTFSMFSQTENVGIGTSTPDNSATLHVQYVSTPKGILIPRMTTTDRGNIPSPANGLLIFNSTTAQFEYYNSSTTSWIPILSNNNVSNRAWSRLGNAGTTPGTDFLGTTDSQALLLYTNNTERMRISATGDVSIASLTADEFVRVASTGEFETYNFSQDIDVTSTGVTTVTGLQTRDVSTTAPTDGQVLTWNNANSVWEPQDVSGGGGGGNTLDAAYDEGGSGAGRTIVADAGAVLINSSNAADEALEVTNSGNGGGILIENTGTGASFRVNDEASDTSPLIVDASGNVGIGTASPNIPLEVNGNFRLGADGTEIAYVLRDTVNIDLPTINAGDVHTETITINNVQIGSTVIVSPSGTLGADIVIGSAAATQADEIQIYFINVRETGAVNRAAQDFYITVIK